MSELILHFVTPDPTSGLDPYCNPPTLFRTQFCHHLLGTSPQNAVRGTKNVATHEGTFPLSKAVVALSYFLVRCKCRLAQGEESMCLSSDIDDMAVALDSAITKRSGWTVDI